MTIEVNDKIYECLKEMGEAELFPNGERTRSLDAEEVLVCAARSYLKNSIEGYEHEIKKTTAKIQVNEIMAEEEETEEERQVAQERIKTYEQRLENLGQGREYLHTLMMEKLIPAIYEMFEHE